GKHGQVTATGHTALIAIANLEAKMRARILRPTSIGGEQITRTTTVKQLIELYLSDLDASDLAAASKTRYRRTALHKIAPVIGDRKLHTLTQGTFAALIREHYAVSPSEGKLVRAVSNNLMALALRHDAIPTNHAFGAAGKLPKISKPDPRVLSPAAAAEVFELLEDARDKARPGPHSRKGLTDLIDALSLQLALGCRVSEALAIQVQDIDWSGQYPIIRIHQAISYQEAKGEKIGARRYEVPGFYFLQPHTKSSDIRLIAVDEFAASILKRRSEDARTNGLLFCAATTGAPLSINNLRRTMRTAIGHSDYAWASTHTMRRSIGTLVGRDTAHGPADGMKLLGHRELSTFVRGYLERDIEVSDVRELSRKFGRPGNA
ncbi:MAG TPA: site-specific integrase, partial [Galbitalea sp.]